MDGRVCIMRWRRDYVDAAIYLVDEAGADVNIENDDGQTPIQVAVDEKVAKYFKEHIEKK